MTTDSVLPAAASGVPTSLRRWKRYPAYWDSGVEWLGKIPEHWAVKRLKNIAVVNPDSLGETTPPDYHLLYVDITNVDSNGNLLDMEDLRFEEAPTRARRRVKHGDTIISTVRTYLKAIAFINEPPDNLIVSTGFAVLRPCGDVHPNYLSRLVQAEPFIQAVVAHSEGVGYPAISPSRLASLRVWLPPLPEQRAIADFVDRETAKIDALVAKKERLVELLQEKRAALISQSVTKGLNPDVPVKDSGTEWLGGIPVRWEVKRLKWVTAAHKQGYYTEQLYADDGVKLARISDIDDFGNVCFNSMPFLDLSASDERAFHLKEGDFLFARSGTIGRFGLVRNRERAVFASYLIRFRFKQVEPEFMRFALAAKVFRESLISALHGGANQNVHAENIKEQSLAFPPLPEQRDIASFLEQETGKIDVPINRIRDQLGRLREYRTALISAAVTGKIDVREKAA